MKIDVRKFLTESFVQLKHEKFKLTKITASIDVWKQLFIKSGASIPFSEYLIDEFITAKFKIRDDWHSHSEGMMYEE